MGEKLSFFYRRNEFSKRFWKKTIFIFILNKWFYWTNDLKNEQFYWTIIQWENERNRWKINDIFRTNEINFSTKSTNEMVRLQTKWKSPSLYNYLNSQCTLQSIISRIIVFIVLSKRNCWKIEQQLKVEIEWARSPLIPWRTTFHTTPSPK